MSRAVHGPVPAVGMDAEISRRDFLNGTLVASGSALLGGLSPDQVVDVEDEWTGYGGVGDYRRSNGNTKPVVDAAHVIRDTNLDTLPPDTIDTGEEVDLAVVGGGISGLAAAFFFQRHAPKGRTCLVLDNHPIFGGEAKQNEFVVDGQRLICHQGSAYFHVPHPESLSADFYNSIGLREHRFEYQRWAGPATELPLSQTPYDALRGEPPSYAFYFGRKFGQQPGTWVRDPWRRSLEGAPLSEAARVDLMRWKTADPAKRATYEPASEGDSISRRLDTMTLEELLMERDGMSRETIRTFLSAVEAGSFGLGADALSAFIAYAGKVQYPRDGDPHSGGQMPLGGNTAIARMAVKALIPTSIRGDHTLDAVSRNSVNFEALDRKGSQTRIRLNSTVVWVRHEGDPARAPFVWVAYLRDGKFYRLKARAVVLAGGSWTTRRIVRDLPAEHREAYSQFHRAPCLMASVAVRNWRFLHKMGITGGRWFEGIGEYTEVRKQALFTGVPRTISPDSPTILTMKAIYSYPGEPIAAQTMRGRAELYSVSFREYERRIREHFADMFSQAGFDAKRDIAGIILNRWGHAYLAPQPGFFFGQEGKPAPPDVLRRAPFGRMAFANTDLRGNNDNRHSIVEAHRAVNQILDRVVGR